MKRARKQCPACGRDVAVRNSVGQSIGGKHTAPHKCPHGRPCIAGTRFSNNGWNPGGARHELMCFDCARAVQ